tara:strand:- start:131 stop:1051 length:921 start_codon:yes stop_codon:yes gene_type:complete
MKKLLLILLCLPMMTLAQQTYVPDDNFENYLETHDLNGDSIALGSPTSMGDGIANNDYVTTASINTVIHLDLSNTEIYDLTGIEDFTALTYLNCYNNLLTSLDLSANSHMTELDCQDNSLTSINVSNNTSLTFFACSFNLLTSLDVSQNIALITLDCDANQLTGLDVSNNTALIELDCFYNQLTSLDVSNNTSLISLLCYENEFTSLDVRNGNNINFLNWGFNCKWNTNLSCINVDNVAWSTTNWTDIDPQHYFSNNCPPSSIQEYSLNKELLKATDLLGRETKQTNQPLFYIYDDGTVEKRIVVE